MHLIRYFFKREIDRFYTSITHKNSLYYCTFGYNGVMIIQTLLCYVYVWVIFETLRNYSNYCTLSGRTGDYPDDDFRKKKEKKEENF